jgi:hypothetical protein
MLDVEGRRCWTLLYASEEGRPGFHIDILPSIKSTGDRLGEIDITDKDSITYSWSSSNPNGYYLWFKSKNAFSDNYIREQEVPKQLVRSNLQRAVQIMKRHRDVFFTDCSQKPISIIITTICCNLYEELGISETIQKFIRYVIKRQNTIWSGCNPEPDGILDYFDGNWSIPNPADRGKLEDEVENFADKWNREPELSKAFFDWIHQLDRDMRIGTSEFTDQLLDLIHLGIEEKLEWETIEAIAMRNVKESTEGESREIARVNYYQTILHQGRVLSNSYKQDIHRILAEYPLESNFVFCGNLLLGTATRKMLQECIQYYGRNNVMEWPIVRLAKPDVLLPPPPVGV